jgi:hypothetical protein
MRLRSGVFAAGFFLALFAAAPLFAEEAASVAAPEDLLKRTVSIAAHGDLRDLAFTEQVLGRILKPEPQWIAYQGERVLADLQFRPRDGLLLPNRHNSPITFPQAWCRSPISATKSSPASSS